MMKTPMGVGALNYLRLRLLKDVPLSFPVRGARVTLGVSSVLELWRGETYETKEPETLDWIDEFAAADIFYDVGANIGLYSLYAATVRRCKVLAFEPEGKNFSRLMNNQVLNGLEEMRAFCIAVGGGLRADQLHVAGSVSGDSQHNIGKENPLFPRECSVIQGSFVMSLDDLCYSFNLPVPQHLKIDVDGLEEEIIGGARRLLRDEGLKTVMIEIAEARGSTSPIYAAMQEAGFAVKLAAKRAYETDSLVARNILFHRMPATGAAISHGGR
jgi:FkbM family methyltransferase